MEGEINSEEVVVLYEGFRTNSVRCNSLSQCHIQMFCIIYKLFSGMNFTFSFYYHCFIYLVSPNTCAGQAWKVVDHKLFFVSNFIAILRENTICAIQRGILFGCVAYFKVTYKLKTFRKKPQHG